MNKNIQIYHVKRVKKRNIINKNKLSNQYPRINRRGRSMGMRKERAKCVRNVIIKCFIVNALKIILMWSVKLLILMDLLILGKDRCARFLRFWIELV
jgi:hypothetical protein